MHLLAELVAEALACGTLDRRQILKLAALAIGTAPLAACGDDGETERPIQTPGVIEDNAADFAADIASYLPGGDSTVLAAMGEHWLRDQSAADEQALLDILSDTIDLLVAADTATAPSMLAAAITDDFAAMNTVQLDGWFLARTEVEMCAIVFLIQ